MKLLYGFRFKLSINFSINMVENILIHILKKYASLKVS